MNDIESLELKIAKFLRYGVLVSGFIMLIGWVLMFKLYTNPYVVYDVYDPLPLIDVLKIHIRNKDYGFLISYIGLASLISLPFIRVLLTAIIFIKQKERLLSVIAFLVLTGLVVSMSLGIDL